MREYRIEPEHQATEPYRFAVGDEEGEVIALCKDPRDAVVVMEALNHKAPRPTYTRHFNDGTVDDGQTAEDVELGLLGEILDDLAGKRWGTIEDEEGNGVPVEIVVRLAPGAEIITPGAGMIREREAGLEDALRKIIKDAPEDEPVYDEWEGDTKKAELWGLAHAAWEAAEIARKALARGGGR